MTAFELKWVTFIGHLGHVTDWRHCGHNKINICCFSRM